jgi:hypothetical protein
MEYEAFDSSLDHIKKPHHVSEIERDQGMKSMHTLQKRETFVPLEEVEQLIDRKLEKFKTEIKDLLKDFQAAPREPKKSEIICNFCKGVGHIESRCYKKFPELRPASTKPAQQQSTLN